MANETKEELERLNNLHIIVETYEEIAALRMRKIRSMVLKSREFVDGITLVYQEIEASYRGAVQRLMTMNKGKKNHTSVIKHNGKTITVFLSANTGLYGDLVARTFDAFKEHIKQTSTEIVISGKIGVGLFKEVFPDRDFTYIELADTEIPLEQIKKLVTSLVAYENVYFFFGKFQSVNSQLVVSLNVSDIQAAQNMNVAQNSSTPVSAAASQASSLAKAQSAPQTKYFFEPSLEKILTFFEEEIFATIIEQTLQESQLAKYAARLFSLDNATVNITTRLKLVDLQERMITHRAQNKKQQESLSGMSLWTK